MPRPHMRLTRCERIQRLRRNRVEQRIDRIGIGGLKSGVGLKSEPRDVPIVDVVIDPSRLHLLAIVARMRNALTVCATIAIRRIPARRGSTAVQGATRSEEHTSELQS